ncbi:Interactor of constitutive active rops 2 protein [Thalictrum thalictroides]|uniref:Interactor of constitutive active rops 2 protein n=1 Tax=Thalictrum thalictroides TaxID=46969 RepID=A0A7J6WYZ5_THATH|nr:Interactor of constitutive active rops 2 protein [Thalictrum thalictroides]
MEMPKRSVPVIPQPKDRSPKVIVRSSPRKPVAEKKPPIKVFELESQVAQLQEDLKNAKEQLRLSESWKGHALKEAEDAKRQLINMKAGLEDSQRQLLELSASDDARLQELCKLSQERDRAWESELEAVRKQCTVDSAIVVSAMNEIQRLKIALEMVSEAEASQAKRAEAALADLRMLKQEHTETLSLVESMRVQLCNIKESEPRDQVNKDTLQSDDLESGKAYSSMVFELNQSRAEVTSLLELVLKLKQDLIYARNHNLRYPSHDGKFSDKIGKTEELDELNRLTEEIGSLKQEVNRLTCALEITEIKFHEEQTRSTAEVQSIYELMEKTKSESTLKEVEMEVALNNSKADIQDLSAKLMYKETELQNILQESEGIGLKIENNLASQRVSDMELEVEKLKHSIENLKANLMDKETELKISTEEIKLLKSEFKSKETEQAKTNYEVSLKAEAAEDAEKEALMMLGIQTKEADKSIKREAWVVEQLEAAQATNRNMEMELRKLKVQADQWRKAAEAAAAILSIEDNEKTVERTSPLSSSYDTFTGRMSSTFFEGLDDESLKKRNMLKKIGDLWKKGQK